MFTRVRVLMSLFLIGTSLSMIACEHGGGFGLAGNERGSQPVNEQEVLEYKRAVLKCYKTGGTRVVKVQGHLRCFN